MTFFNLILFDIFNVKQLKKISPYFRILLKFLIHSEIHIFIFISTGLKLLYRYAENKVGRLQFVQRTDASTYPEMIE